MGLIVALTNRIPIRYIHLNSSINNSNIIFIGHFFRFFQIFFLSQLRYSLLYVLMEADMKYYVESV